jgi:hypothetical protein
MRMVRLMRLKDFMPSALLPERAITHGGMGKAAAANWEYAHVRTADELGDEIDNDEIHGVKNAGI